MSIQCSIILFSGLLKFSKLISRMPHQSLNPWQIATAEASSLHDPPGRRGRGPDRGSRAIRGPSCNFQAQPRGPVAWRGSDRRRLAPGKGCWGSWRPPWRRELEEDRRVFDGEGRRGLRNCRAVSPLSARPYYRHFIFTLKVKNILMDYSRYFRYILFHPSPNRWRGQISTIEIMLLLLY